MAIVQITFLNNKSRKPYVRAWILHGFTDGERASLLYQNYRSRVNETWYMAALRIDTTWKWWLSNIDSLYFPTITGSVLPKSSENRCRGFIDRFVS